MAIPEEVMSELRSKYKRICVVPYGKDGLDVVIRAPSRAEYKAWRAKKDSPDAQEDTIRQLVVYVNGTMGPWPQVVAVFDQLLEDWPALCDAKAPAQVFADFAGLSFSDSGKG